MDEALAILLELRIRARGRPQAMALIDRRLRRLARQKPGDRAAEAKLEQDISELRRELEAQMAPPDRPRPR